MRIKKAVIAVAGFGSRFLPITKTVPKQMLPILDKPIIHWVVQEVAEAGIDEIFIITTPEDLASFGNYFFQKNPTVKELMYSQGKADRWRKVEDVFKLPQIRLIPQPTNMPYGNGTPFLTVRKELEKEDAFVAIFGDDLVLGKESATKQLIRDFKKYPCDALLAVQEMPDLEVSRTSAAKIKKGTKDIVEDVVEKPSLGKAPSNLVSYGRFILTPKIFKYLKEDGLGKDNELWLSDANCKLAHNGVVRAKVLKDSVWVTTGDPLHYLQAHLMYALADKEIGKSIEAQVRDLVCDRR